MNSHAESERRRTELTVGSRVDVHTRYELGRWVPGFTIAEIRPDGYRIERASDGSVLGAAFGAHELRAVVTPPTTARVRDALRAPAAPERRGSLGLPPIDGVR
jgi:hypothetical protein